jgi:HK97 family phage prohead protease
VPAIKHLNCDFEIKSLNEDGTFAGWASKYSVVDSYSDRVMRGAFTKTIQERPQVPILWQHDANEVIGMGRLTDHPDGLQIEGSFDLDDPVAAKAYRKLKNGLIKGLSIGFTTIKDSVKDGIRDLLELKLWEVSVVTFPALGSATVTSVKEIPLEETPAGEDDKEPQELHSLLLELKASQRALLEK